MDASTTLFALTSPAFADGKPIPAEHAMPPAGGRNVSVPLAWSGAPEGTRSFALECVDLHPIARSWVHWLVVDLPADTTGLAAGASPDAMPAGSRELTNSYGATGWGGPQPPPGTGAHEYRFVLYALDVERLDVARNASLDDFRSALDGHVLAKAELTGTFERR